MSQKPTQYTFIDPVLSSQPPTIDQLEQRPRKRRKRSPPPPPKSTPEFTPYSIDEQAFCVRIPEQISSTSPAAIWAGIFEGCWPRIVSNTNQCARQNQSRWKDADISEIQAFVGLQIYMGIHHEPDVKDYWEVDVNQQQRHTLVVETMSRNRFQDLNRFFHVDFYREPHETEQKKPWEYIQSTSEHCKRRFQEFATPSSHLAVDEMMQGYTGRCKHTVTIPGKPTLTGLKIYALASESYVIDWLWSSYIDGIIDLDDSYAMSDTQAIVPSLLTRFQRHGGFKYVCWVDNLFTSSKLAAILANLGYGLGGTVRNDGFRGFDPELHKIRQYDDDLFPRGDLYEATFNDMLCVLWKDTEHTVAFMSNIVTPSDFV